MWPSVVVQIWHMRKDSGAQKRLICAPIAFFVQLVRKKGGFAHGFHSRPFKVSGFTETRLFSSKNWLRK